MSTSVIVNPTLGRYLEPHIRRYGVNALGRDMGIDAMAVSRFMGEGGRSDDRSIGDIKRMVSLMGISLTWVIGGQRFDVKSFRDDTVRSRELLAVVEGMGGRFQIQGQGRIGK